MGPVTALTHCQPPRDTYPLSPSPSLQVHTSHMVTIRSSIFADAAGLMSLAVPVGPSSSMINRAGLNAIAYPLAFTGESDPLRDRSRCSMLPPWPGGVAMAAAFVRSAWSSGLAPARYSSTRQNTSVPFSPAPYWARAHMRNPVSSHIVFMLRRITSSCPMDASAPNRAR